MFRFLSFTAATAAFALAVLGSWVRINGAGMTCPDWPLCHGSLVPVLQGGVILEWSHRLIAFALVFPVAGALAAAWRERRRITGIVPTVAFVAAVFVVQVLLGAATVRLSNVPWSVALHWGTGMLFLAGLVALALLSAARPSPGRPQPARSALLPLLWVGSFVLFATMCAGAYVSSSGAGLACATIPLCDESWFGIDPPQIAQMVHRILATVFFALATIAVYAAGASAPARVRNAMLVAYSLVVLQIALGIANVAWQLPVALREAHAANAAATFVAYISVALLAGVDGSVREPLAERAAAPPAVYA